MSYICCECDEECTPKEIDEGIGPYSFWGQKGHHREMDIISSCCEATIVDEFGNRASYDDWKDDEDAAYGDYLYEMAKDAELEARWEAGYGA